MKRKLILILILGLSISNIFNSDIVPDTSIRSISNDDFLDISSFSNINKIRQNKINLDLNIDFDNKR